MKFRSYLYALPTFFLMFIAGLLVGSEVLQVQLNMSNASDAGVQIEVESAIILEVSTNDVYMGEANAIDSTLATGNLVAKVWTNDPLGYTLSLNMLTTDQCLRTVVYAGDACSGLDDKNKIGPIGTPSVATASFPVNSWGASRGAFDVYYPVPASDAASWNVKTSTNSVQGEETTVRMGVKADMSLIPGNYRNTMVLNAVTTPLPLAVITSISPTWGDPGTPITLTGTNFDYLYEVLFNGYNCDNLAVVDDTTATCEAPTGPVGVLPAISISVFGHINQNTPTFGWPQEFKFTVNTKLTDVIDTNAGYQTGTATTFIIPTQGFVSGNMTKAYSWRIDWGDGSAIQTATGVGAAAGITHDYVSTGGAGEYQITIMSNGGATAGWLDAFGFGTGTTGAAAAANKNKIKTIDTSITDLMRTRNATYRFAYMFDGTRNLRTIPAWLFDGIDMTGSTNLSYMFMNMFNGAAYNSTVSTIPSGLFDFLEGSNASGTNAQQMFRNTFTNYGYNSTVANVPLGLFDYISTIGATDLSYMFYQTFMGFGYNSTVATLPTGLFSCVNTAKTANMTYMFYGAFQNFGYRSQVAAVPAGLFNFLDFGVTTNTAYMFYQTFSSFAYTSTSTVIPAGLMNSINLTNVTTLTSMFLRAFENFAYANTTASTDVLSIWTNANFAGKVTQALAGGTTGVFYYTFNNARSITGYAQSFVTNKLGGITPAARAYTFTGSGALDALTIADNWR